MDDLLNTICPLEKMGKGIKNIRHRFFHSIETEIQAYLLGFIAADGSIDEKRNALSIHVSAKDIEIPQLFQKWVSPESSIESYVGNTFNSRGKTYTSKDSVRINITSKQLISDLKNLGITQAKTWRELHIPNIDESLIKHFIRGYFDGDGCITGWLATEKGKADRVRYKFDICSKTITMLSDIQKVLSKNDINVNINYLKRDDMYRISTSSKSEVSKLYHYLYDDANFYLSRKFNKFSYYVNTEVSQIISDTVTHRE